MHWLIAFCSGAWSTLRAEYNISRHPPFCTQQFEPHTFCSGVLTTLGQFLGIAFHTPFVPILWGFLRWGPFSQINPTVDHWLLVAEIPFRSSFPRDLHDRRNLGTTTDSPHTLLQERHLGLVNNLALAFFTPDYRLNWAFCGGAKTQAAFCSGALWTLIIAVIEWLATTVSPRYNRDTFCSGVITLILVTFNFGGVGSQLLRFSLAYWVNWLHVDFFRDTCFSIGHWNFGNSQEVTSYSDQQEEFPSPCNCATRTLGFSELQSIATAGTGRKLLVFSPRVIILAFCSGALLTLIRFFSIQHSFSILDFSSTVLDTFCSGVPTLTTATNQQYGVGFRFLLFSLARWGETLHFIGCSVLLLLLALWALELCRSRQDKISGFFSAERYFFSHTVHPDSTDRNSGPKSRGISRLTRLFVALLFQTTIAWRFRGEGWILAMEDSGAPPWISCLSTQRAKQHGTPPGMGLGRNTWSQAESKVKKRSLQRAYRRAARDGCAWYRGQCWTTSDFPKSLQQQYSPTSRPIPFPKETRQYNERQRDSRRLRLLTWNCGGLSKSKLDDVRLWMEQQCLDGMVFTETRWKFTSEWSDNAWNYIHSSDEQVGAQGLLIMLHRRICHPNSIRWQALMAGRLLHVQLRLSQRCMDVIACYQYSAQTDASRLTARRQWRDLLDRTLQSLPRRNVLVILGDFNCALSQTAGHSGPSHFQWQNRQVTGKQHVDQGHFLNIIRVHGLNVLNSWHPNLGPTYVKGDTCSRIDFVLVRQHYADRRSKAIKYLWEAPFLSTVQNDHVPILCQIPKMWIPPISNDNHNGISSHQRNLGRMAFLSGTAAWQDFMADSAGRLTSHMHTKTDDLKEMHTQLMHSFKTHFSEQPHPGLEVWQARSEPIRGKWQHRQACLSIRPTACHRVSALAAIRAWYHLTRFQALSRYHRKHAAQVRHSRFQEIITEAQTAADRSDIHKLFQIIHRFAPKQPKRRVQIRNHSGQVASPVEELAILSQYVKDAWQGPSLEPMHPHVIPGTPFGLHDLLRALQRIPIGKAVAAPCAPGLLWKAHATLIAPWLYTQIQAWWNTPTPHVPQTWKQGWIHFLTKPNRAPISPDVLRPICLQDPVGKAVIGLLGQIGQAESFPTLRTWPLWGYLPKRSTQDAILRVCQHCSQAVDLVATERSTPHRRAQSRPRSAICGAVQLFIDLQRAFDTIDRSRLFSRLGELGVSPKLVKLLNEWHRDSEYLVTVGDTTNTVPTYCGVRQDCKAAPWLWNSVMAMLLQDLSCELGTEWIRQHVNLYADDGQTGDLFTSETELHAILKKFGWILHMFQQYGLDINTNKSVILITMGGSNGRKCRASLTFHRNGQEWIKIPGPTTSFQIPVSEKAQYLGVIVNYKGTMNELTVKHRTQVAQIAFARLSKWLTGRRGLKASDRFQLWRTCVLSVLTYGIFPVGLNAKCIHHLQKTIYGMIRKIYHCHAYHTRLTHEEVLHRYHTPSPIDLLWTAADVLRRSVTQRNLFLASDDIVTTLDWGHLISVQQMLAEHHTPGEGPPAFEVPEVMPSTLFCTECGFVASDVATLRRHYSIMHELRMYRTYHGSLAKSMQNGLPQCTHCHRIFTTWRSFTTHMQRGCQVTHRDPSRRAHLFIQPEPKMPTFPTKPPLVEAVVRGSTMLTAADLQNIHQQEWGRRLLVIIGHRHWQHLRLEAAANEYLAKRCCLWDQWVGRAQEMHKHMRLFHAEHWNNVMPRSTQLSNLYAHEAPCSFSKCVFKTTHSCNVWTQVALLLIGGAGITENMPSELPSTLACEVCNQELPSLEAKQLHLIQEHQLTQMDWNVSRDAKDGAPTCAHCHTEFGSMASLRSHIVQGRCSGFDATQSTEPLPVQEAWKTAMCKGELLYTLRDPQVRLALTLRCQCCPQKYSRAGDLALHLQSSHPALWTASEPLTMILVDLYYHQIGCVCNPSTSVKRLNHICLPWRQLAIQHCRLGPEDLFMPTLLQESDLHTVYHVDLPRQVKFAVDKLICDRLFTTMWNCQELTDILRTTCLQCGGFYHPAELALHIREAHHCNTELVQYYMHALTPLMLECNLVDYHCATCGLIYNVPALSDEESDTASRQRLVQAHCRAQCPVLLQAALVLSLVTNGGRQRDAGTHGRLGTGLEHLQIHGSLSGPQPEAGGQPRSAETATKRRRSQTSQRSSGITRRSQGLDPNGQIGAQTGSGDSVHKKGGHLSALFQQQRENRRSAADGADSCSMAPPDATVAGPEANDAIETEAPAGAPARTSAEDDQAGRGTPAIRPRQSGNPKQRPVTRHEMPIHGMGPEGQAAQDQPAHSLDAQEDGGKCDRVPGDVHPSGLDSPLPLAATPRSSDALEIAAEPASGSRIPADAGVLPIQHLAFAGGDGEGTQPSSKPPCITISDDHGISPDQGEEQGPWERQEQAKPSDGEVKESNQLDRQALRHTISNMVLVNPNNWCFANASVYSVLWTTLSVRNFESATWGRQCHHLCDFLDRMTRVRGDLSLEPWFTEMLRCWGRTELAQSHGSIAQNDAAEFVSFWLESMATPTFDMAWERRVEENGLTHTVDKCIRHHPLFFQFAPIDQQASIFDLSVLASRWSQVDGMSAGLLHTPDCACIHIDRCVQDSDGRVMKCTSALQTDVECLLPILMGDTTECQYLEYQITALMSHLGGDGNGHYRAALKLRPGVTDSATPYRWLLTDDWSPATLVWNLPSWFLENVTMAWVTRSDRLDLYDHSQKLDSAPAQHDPVAAMLALLSSATKQRDSSSTTKTDEHDQKDCDF